jgi:hypothetical protein
LLECGDDFAARAVGQLRIQHAINRRVEPQIGGGQGGQWQQHQQGEHEAAQGARFGDQVA